jgi:hypothetical protein
MSPQTLAVEGLEGGGRHFAYTTMLARPSVSGGVAPEPPGVKLPGRAEVMDFLRACIRSSGGPADGGASEAAAGSPEGADGVSPRKRAAAAALLPSAPALSGPAGAAFAAAISGAANATDSGVRKRQAPERFDPRPERRVPSSGALDAMAGPPDFTRFAAAASGAGGGMAGGFAGDSLFGPGAGGHPALHPQALHPHPSQYPQRGMEPLTIRHTPPTPHGAPMMMGMQLHPLGMGMLGAPPQRAPSGGFGALLPPPRPYGAYTPVRQCILAWAFCDHLL